MLLLLLVSARYAATLLLRYKAASCATLLLLRCCCQRCHVWRYGRSIRYARIRYATLATPARGARCARALLLAHVR